MVTPYKQIHLEKAHVPWNSNTKGWSTPHPLDINVHDELAHEDLSAWIDENNNLTGPAQEHLSEQDTQGNFV